MPEQWHRALLRAALRDVGYDAVGTRTLETALRIRPDDPDRGPVRLVVVDQSALDDADRAERLAQLLARHGEPQTILLARSTTETPGGPWQRVLRRPFSIADVVTAVASLLPLPAAGRRSLD